MTRPNGSSRHGRVVVELGAKALSLLLPLAIAGTFLILGSDRIRPMGKDLALAAAALVSTLLIGIFSADIARGIRKLSRRRVFISYPHSAGEVVASIVSRLKDNGTRVWLDAEQVRPGDSIRTAIEGALDDSDVVVFVFRRTMTEYSSQELRLARSKGVRIIPVRVDNDATVPPELQGIKYVDLTSQPWQGIDEIVSAVG